MYREKVQIQGLERDFEVERVGSKMEKITVVVVLVIGVMSSRYWTMEARVREIESNNEDGGSGEREYVGVKDRVRVFFLIFFLYIRVGYG